MNLKLKWAYALAMVAIAVSAAARVLPETIVLSQCEFYPLREQDRGLLYRYTDQPLFVDPDLPEDEPSTTFETRRHRYWGEWFSQADWNRAEELGKGFGLDGHAFFPRPHRARYWDAMERSPIRGFLEVPIAHNYSNDGSDLSQWFTQAVRSSRGYRFNGKTLILSYRFEYANPPERLKMKLDRMRREVGDSFMFVCDLSSLYNPDEALARGRLSDETIAKYKEKVRSYLRVCDGIIIGDGFSCMRFEGKSRVFFSSLYEQLVKLLSETVEEPEFKGRKLLGLSAVLQHENPARQFWTANEDGLHTLTESLRIVCAAKPDIILMPEWDELNENTCIGPTLANSMSVRRILNYYLAKLKGKDLQPLDDEDGARPNLIISYRRSVSPGERLIVDVLNVPDGSRTGNLSVSLQIADCRGNIIHTGSKQSIDESELRHLRFPVDSIALSKATRAANVRVFWQHDSGKRGIIDNGLHCIELAPANGYCLKEVHQPIRELAEINGEVAMNESGRIHGELNCRESIRYAYVCGNGQIQRIIGNPESPCTRFTEDSSNAVFMISGIRPEMIDRGSFEYRVSDPHFAEWLDRRGVHTGCVFKTDWLATIGDPYFLRIPRSEASNATLEIDFGNIFRGKIPLGIAFERGTYALGGSNGVQFAVNRMRRQSRYPSPANQHSITLNHTVDADRASMVYHVQVVTVSGKIWRSRPFVCEPESESVPMIVGDAISGSVRQISLPKCRVPEIQLDFAPETGTWVPTTDGMRRFSTILGGQFSLATLWNRNSAGGFDYPEGIKPDWKAITVPNRIQESDGSWALEFDGIDDFMLFPWETIPQNSGYRITFRILPRDLSGTTALFESKNNFTMCLDEGTIQIKAAGVRMCSTGLRLNSDRWNSVTVVHSGNALTVKANNQTFRTAATLPATCMSPLAFAIPTTGSKARPFKGRLSSLTFTHTFTTE